MDANEINTLMQFGYDLGQLPAGMRGGISQLESRLSGDENKRDFVKKILPQYRSIFEKYEKKSEEYLEVPFVQTHLKDAREASSELEEAAKPYI